MFSHSVMDVLLVTNAG